MPLEINYDKIQEFIYSANRLRNDHVLEDVLRHNLSSWMPQMFPQCPWWLTAHVSGTERRVNYSSLSGANRGFVDSLVGKTVIEYEKNLTVVSVFNSGYGQVQDYCAALLNDNVNSDDIMGVLSDTVEWYAYRISNITAPERGRLFGRDNIELTEIEHISLDRADSIDCERFVQFIIQYIGREGSRTLNAATLAGDMGFNSLFCRDHISKIALIIEKAFNENEKYANLIKTLWGNFVSYVGGNSVGNHFDLKSYINEFYIITLAKYLCVNILEQKSVISDKEHSLEIMDGTYFKAKGYANLVEYDYFGWINSTPYAESLIPVAEKIQRDLAAYDFLNVVSEDLFGPLVAQLAQREQRILLGQEYTPQWLAQKIVQNVMKSLSPSDYPRFLDMCCGSGVFIVETLKQTIDKHLISVKSCTQNEIDLLQQAVMGFDIDPLAVMLSKVNWVLIMKDFVIYSKSELVIPVFHADSLFMITPVSKNITRDFDKSFIELVFGNKKILLPGFLLSPQNGGLFDHIIRNSYSIAMERAIANKPPLEKQYISEFISITLHNVENTIDSTNIEVLQTFCFELINTLEQMQRDGQNGIWAFVLENSYRPALVAGRFNGIVSNPPWLAMSKLADNPYKYELEKRATHYKIKPKGSSHLHTELSTIFLLQSVEYYLCENAMFGCIIPDSVLNGAHHDLFRRKQYNKAQPNVNLNVKEIWEVDSFTFKNKAVVLFGDNKANGTLDLPIDGGAISSCAFEKQQYHMLYQGKRSAWSTNCGGKSVETVEKRMPFLQGADIMPRTLVFYNCTKQPNGKWSILSIPRQNHSLSYMVADAKKHKNFNLSALNIDDCFLYRCLTSNHLAPFYVSTGADAVLPIQKDDDSNWTVISKADMLLKGTTVYEAFKSILNEGDFTVEEYLQKLNYRNKLNPQQFTNKGWLVVVGAGGSSVCAGYINLASLPVEKLIVDQTLYWYVAQSEEEAIYITGLLNSEILDLLISEFQPEGLQGKRHVHKLPYAITPVYDGNNFIHNNVVNKTKALLNDWNKIQNQDAIENLISTSTLTVRRRKIRVQLQKLPTYAEYEKACKELYGM